jgi:glycosyltransferase involved in cell wall biosynthesis
MKILMISDVYFPRVNGVSTSIQTFRRELAALGHHVDLIAPAYPEPYTEDNRSLRVPSRYLPFDPEDRMMIPGAVRRLLPQLREAAYDLVHIQTPFVAHYLGIEIADLLDIPRMETYHTFFEEYLYHYVPVVPKAALRALSRRFSRAQCNQMDALVVPSAAMRDKLVEYGVRVPMHVVPTGIPPAQFAAGDGDAFRVAHGIPGTRRVLLFVGRVAFEKNIDFLLRALERAVATIPDLLLVIAGEGPALASLKRLAARLNLQEHTLFVGYLDRRGALLDCYCGADAFVFASRTETQGLVLLEAMALGLPVISTAVMGTRDIVGPKRGALVPDDDEADFAEHVVRLMRDGDLRARLAEEGRAYVCEWHAGALARKLFATYQEVVATNPAARAASCPA